MKKILSIAFVGFLISPVFGQTVITLQPNGSEGKDAYVHSLSGYETENFGTISELTATAWTFQGVPGVVRALLAFDLPEVPPDMQLIDAQLSLFSNNTSAGFGLHSSLSGSNACFISRVTDSWSENTVSWQNQPAFTVENQIVIDQSSSVNQDYTDLNVTGIVSEQLSDPNVNFGFIIRLQNESFYRRMNFASSDHEDPNRRPKLVLTFQESLPIDSCLIIQPDAQAGKDAYIQNLPGYTDLNFGDNNQFVATAWTFQGVPGIVRSLLQFDLSGIPENAVIQSANLSLKAFDSTAGMGLHSTLSGSNESILQRITSIWEENMVTWNTHPTFTAENQVFLPPTTSIDQNFDNIDVTFLVKDMILNPSESYGFLLSLLNEEYYRRINFASSNHLNESLRPKIEVCYSTPSNSINQFSNSFTFSLYPNPSNSQITIVFTEPENPAIELEVFDLQGRLIINLQQINSGKIIDITHLETGIYNLVLRNEERIASKKFVVQK